MLSGIPYARSILPIDARDSKNAGTERAIRI
jgi:hypothetical protein